MGAEQEVIDAANDRARALASADAGRLRELLHEQFRWTSHLGRVLDRTEYIDRNTGGHTIWRSQALSEIRVEVVGTTAVLHAEVTDVVLSGDGEPQTYRMPVTQVWVRVDSGWRCLAGHAGPQLTAT